MSHSVRKHPSAAGVPSSSQEVIFWEPDTPLISPIPNAAEGNKGHRRNTSSIDSAINPGEEAVPLLDRNSNKGVPSITRNNTDAVQLNLSTHCETLEDFGTYLWRQSSQLLSSSSYSSLPSNTTFTNDKYAKQHSFTKYDAGQYVVGDQSPTSSRFLESPLTPSFTSNTSYGTSKQHPFAKGFERPNWRHLAMHTALCGLTYPFVLIFVILAQEKSLFWTRFFVSMGCGISGSLMGWSLMRLARGILEASTWATLIHQSHAPREAGVCLKDLVVQCDDSNSAVKAFRLLWIRRHYPGADIKHRRDYDSRRWPMFVLFFLSIVALAGLLSFVFGRIVNIEVRILHQNNTYYEVAVWGDLSDGDVQRANGTVPAFTNTLLTWTLAPFSTHGGLPEVVSFPYRNDTVYFSEVILSQLLPSGSGFGTFETNTTAASIDINPGQLVVQGDPIMGVEPGSLLRITCAKIPDGKDNIIPLSENSLTYLLTPRDTIQALYSALNLPFPPSLEQPLNVSSFLQPNDTLPTTSNISQIALGAAFWDNGVAHSMKSTPMDLGQNGTGFVTIENILVRLNSSYAPNGTFSARRTQTIPDVTGQETFIGYDAAVCLELYDPWVLEVYNSSVSSPTSTKIVGPGSEILDVVAWERMKGKPLIDPIVKIQLNSGDMSPVYIAAHQNSVNQILKDNGRDSYYVPSPTLISFTSGQDQGQDPRSYTELSPVLYAEARALADASNVLPYFVGSGQSLARSYPDRVVAYASIKIVGMVVVTVTIFFMGLLSGLFVPRLPLDAPRRGFDLYSWMSAFYAREVVAPDRSSEISKNMELEEMEKNLGEIKFRYAG